MDVQALSTPFNVVSSWLNGAQNLRFWQKIAARGQFAAAILALGPVTLGAVHLFFAENDRRVAVAVQL